MNNDELIFSETINKIRNYANKVQNLAVKARLIGRVNSVKGFTVEARNFHAPVSSRCYILSRNNSIIDGEVIGFKENISYIMCFDNVSGIAHGDKVLLKGDIPMVKVGESLKGRILNGKGEVIDGKPPPITTDLFPINGKKNNPLKMNKIEDMLDVGIKSINTMLTIGRGQRIGLFSSSGLGKSVLLSMITKFSKADVVVIALIGERGREINDFIQQSMNEETRKKTIVVCAPANESALLRIGAANISTSIGEYFRNQGKNVLLLFDSITRFAHACREIGLSIGEPSTLRGYTPSVFTKLNELLERGGNASHSNGTMTSIYSVLLEDSYAEDPIAESVKSILDGHIYLSKDLSEEGNYPAIDINKSISRLMSTIVSKENYELSMKFKYHYNLFMKNKDILDFGTYEEGRNSDLDFSIKNIQSFKDFLKQDKDIFVDYQISIHELENILKSK